MRVTLLTLLAGVAALHTATMPSADSKTISKCNAQMDGSLPYYVPKGFIFSGNIRRYYVSAEIETWNYAPSGWDNVLGVPMNQSFRAQTWGYIPTNQSLGTIFDKALYRGYTGPDFKTRTEQPPWQGYMGPTIRGEIGDMIEILLVNNLESFYVSMHNMGLFYPKEYEGGIYWNSTTQGPSVGDAIAPGECFVYKWLVPETSIPGSDEPSALFSYHSYVSMYQDQDAGLSGPVIIYRPGAMEQTMASYREFVLGFFDNQESNSFLASHNIMKYLPVIAGKAIIESSQIYPKITSKGNYSIWYPQLVNSPATPDLTSSILPNFFPLNGYIFANAPPFEMCLGDKVIWYLWDMGFDTHVFHLHGENVVMSNVTMPSVPLNPGQMLTAHMTASNPGLWEVICHFSTHLNKGMEANYIVYGGVGPACTLPPLKPLP